MKTLNVSCIFAIQYAVSIKPSKVAKSLFETIYTLENFFFFQSLTDSDVDNDPGYDVINVECWAHVCLRISTL